MQSAFEEIRLQIHDIRNLLGPIDIKLENLDHQLTVGRMTFDAKASDLESKIAVNGIRVADQTARIEELSEQVASHSERLKRLEGFLKLSTGEQEKQSPTHEDKRNPSVLPPQNPGLA